MKFNNATCNIFFILSIALSLQTTIAQDLVIPRSSPRASVSQYIGVCNIIVEYGRPGVKNRRVLGQIIPYDKIWRAGANEATTISFNHAITINQIDIPAGRYSLFIVPKRSDRWELILNKTADQWGAYSHDENEDIARIEVNQKQGNFTELCTYSFVNVGKTKASLRLQWENFEVDIPIETKTHQQTLKEIEASTSIGKAQWYNFSAAAQYHFYERKDTEKALELIDIAIALKSPNPSPWMLKSQIYAYLENYEEAINYAEEAIVISKNAQLPHEVEENEQKIALWKKKL